MILVTGGSSQGKREFVRQYLGGQDTEPVVWTEGAEAPGRNLWTAGSAVISSSLSGG